MERCLAADMSIVTLPILSHTISNIGIVGSGKRGIICCSVHILHYSLRMTRPQSQSLASQPTDQLSQDLIPLVDDDENPGEGIMWGRQGLSCRDCTLNRSARERLSG